MWLQRSVNLPPRSRGFHLITRDVLDAVPELAQIHTGLLHLFLRHTSAALTLNENASPAVRTDLRAYFDRAVPDGAPYFQHTLEGPDDMSAHVKTSILGPEVTLPIRRGVLDLGTWQGIYLCEHRDAGGSRELLATIWGEPQAA